jgi:hypothetical protein
LRGLKPDYRSYYDEGCEYKRDLANTACKKFLNQRDSVAEYEVAWSFPIKTFGKDGFKHGRNHFAEIAAVRRFAAPMK